MLEEEKNNLIELFQTDIKIAAQYVLARITKSQGLNTFEEYEKENKKPENVCTCQRSWNKPHLAVHCNTCSDIDNSCFCLDCFLNGDHDGHDIILRPYSCGNCDCGDSSALKTQGFCKDHQPKTGDPDIEQIEEKHRKLLLDVFNVVASVLLKFIQDGKKKEAKAIQQFCQNFLSYGEGYRRIITRGIVHNHIIEYVFDNVASIKERFQEIIVEFWGALINDQIFSESFVEVVFPRLINITKEFQNSKVCKNLSSFIFHIFTSISIKSKSLKWQYYTVSLYHYIAEALRENLYTKAAPYVEESAIYIRINYTELKNPQEIDILIKTIIDMMSKDFDAFNMIMYGDTQPPSMSLLSLDYAFHDLGNCISMTKSDDYTEHLVRIAKIEDGSAIAQIGPDSPEYFIPFVNVVKYAGIGGLLASGVSDYAEAIREAAKRAEMDVDAFAENFMGSLMRYYGAFELSMMGAVPPANDIVASSFSFLRGNALINVTRTNLQSFVQILLGSVNDKNRFLKFLMRTMCLLEIDDEDYRKLRTSAFVFAVGTLVMDRRILVDEQDACLDIVRAHLAEKPLPIDNIPKIKHANRVLRLCKKETRGSSEVFVLPDSEWNPLSAMAPSGKARGALGERIEKKARIPFPDKPEDRFGLELISAVESPAFLAAAYTTLDTPMDAFIVTKLLALDLRLRKGGIPKISEESGEVVEAKTLKELVEKMPSDLESALTTRFAFMEEHPSSLIEKLRACYGGKEVIDLIEAGLGKSNNDAEEEAARQREERKKRAMEAKARALAKVNEEKKAFNFEELKEEEEETAEATDCVCAVCSKPLDDLAVLTAYEFGSKAVMMTDHCTTPPPACVSCPHKFHINCVQPGPCPLCRFPKRSFIPLIPMDVPEGGINCATDEDPLKIKLNVTVDGYGNKLHWYGDEESSSLDEEDAPAQNAPEREAPEPTQEGEAPEPAPEREAPEPAPEREAPEPTQEGEAPEPTQEGEAPEPAPEREAPPEGNVPVPPSEPSHPKPKNPYLKVLPKATAELMQRRGIKPSMWALLLAGTISHYEVRLRSTPDGIDLAGPELIKALYRALHYSRIAIQDSFDVIPNIVGALQVYFYNISEHLDPTPEEDKAAYDAALAELKKANESPEYQLAFERRIHLFKMMLAGNRYVTLEGTLPKLQPVLMPNRFIDIYRPPYNVDIWNREGTLIYSLITGKVTDGVSSKDPPDIYLIVRGTPTTAVVQRVPTPGRILAMQPIYVDELGNADINHERGMDLYLDKEALEQVVLNFLLCKWQN